MAFDAVQIGGGLIQSLVSAASLPGNIQQNLRNGHSMPAAVADAAYDGAAGVLLHPTTFIAQASTRALARAVYRGFAQTNQRLHQINTPFSQQFHHTQRTASLQSYGLSRIAGMRGVGDEAARMYGAFQR